MPTIQDVQIKAAREPDFRAKLISDPIAALRSLNIEVPGNVEINVVEDTGSRLTLPIPPAVDVADLTAAQLELVPLGRPVKIFHTELNEQAPWFGVWM